MPFKSLYYSVIYTHIDLLKRLQKKTDIEISLKNTANILVTAFRNSNKLLLFGNGGSAADAQHIATELVSKFFMERSALDAEALNTNTSSLTAIGNDYSFDRIFSRQVEAKGKKDDVLIGITTSGKSKNIIEAFKTGKDTGTKNICLTSENAPVSLKQICDIVIRVPSSCTPRIQEIHILIGHVLCEYVEKELFRKDHYKQ